MYLSFSFLSIVTSILSYSIIKNKEYKKTYLLYFIFIFIIFYSPSVYYIFEGTSYRFFSNESFIHYMNYSSIIMVINIMFLYLKSYKYFPLLNKNFATNISESNNKTPIYIYFSIVVLITLIYIGIYFIRFPLISLLFKGELLERPDVTGFIPHFYSFSSIMLFIIPSFFFYIIPSIKSNYTKIALFVFILLLLTISGHKGIITFFAIFYWIIILKRRISYKFVIIIVILVAVYAVTKGVNELNYQSIEYLTTSPARRLFVTQGVCFIFRFHTMDIQYIFNDIEPIKNQICNFMYNGDSNGCSSPTFFIGDIMIRQGIYFATSIYIISLYIFTLLMKNIDTYFENNYFLKWNIFSIFFLLGMAELSFESSLRLLLVVFNVIVVFTIPKIYNKIKSSKLT